MRIAVSCRCGAKFQVTESDLNPKVADGTSEEEDVDDHSAGSDGECAHDEEIIDEEIISPTSYVTCFLCKVMNNDNNVLEVEECRKSGIR